VSDEATDPAALADFAVDRAAMEADSAVDLAAMEADSAVDLAAMEADPTVAPAGERVPRADSSVELARIVEALLFLSSDPLSVRELGDACGLPEEEVAAALALLGEQYAPGRRGIQLRELAGGYTLASDPVAEEAARRMLGRPRTAALSPAQAETLAIVAYLQPISRPEITRIRGVSADSAAATLLERGLLEEAGRSQFGAVMYRTGTQFLKLFGLRSLQDLPDVAKWDPTPEEQSELRERLLRAGEARSGGTGGIQSELPIEDDQAATSK
jgi:segregation and condensation protein B